MYSSRLQSIIISRFFHDLRTAVQLPDAVTSSQSQTPDENLSRILGNLGGSLAHDVDGVPDWQQDVLCEGGDELMVDVEMQEIASDVNQPYRPW